METIRILIYADSNIFTEEAGSLGGGLFDLERFTKETTKGVANVSFHLLQRHGFDEHGREINGQNPLTSGLLSEFEEVWFFGIRQIDTEQEPNNELKDAEVEALRDWMRRGGVFLTGDHSSPDPTDPNSNCHEKSHESFLGLGRALGHRIPRAGQLRVWKGPPTACLEGELSDLDNFNTQDGFEPCLLDDPLRQFDDIAQTLDLTLKECIPHRLFWFEDKPGGDVTIIKKLPDHLHEGEVIVPPQLDDEWPVHSLPPEIVARGKDNRFPLEQRFRGLIAAYDGFEDEANEKQNAGRIVADSSFHHYLDINLQHLKSRDRNGLPIPGSDLDQIAHFYGQLALWLAPRECRVDMKRDLLLRLAKHPDVVEVMGNSTEVIGRTAKAVLHASIGPSKLRRLMARSQFERSYPVDEVFSLVTLGKTSLLPVSFEKSHLFLGSAMQICHSYFNARGDHIPNLLRNRELVKTIEGSIASTVVQHLQSFGHVFQQLETLKGDDHG